MHGGEAWRHGGEAWWHGGEAVKQCLAMVVVTQCNTIIIIRGNQVEQRDRHRAEKRAVKCVNDREVLVVQRCVMPYGGQWLVPGWNYLLQNRLLISEGLKLCTPDTHRPERQ